VSVAELPVPGRPDEQQVVIETREPTRALHTLTAWAVEKGVELGGLTVATRSLEDAYLDLVGR
jgi:ABC-2 type transport system ATP-binding protein